MVFETLVADLLNRYLGNYLETLSASQLSLGLLSGNVSLENVDVRATAFDDFDIPVRVIQGHIRHFTLKIPFKNLYTEPVVAELSGLYILAVPRADVIYEESKERQYRREAKRKTLKAIDEIRRERRAEGNESTDSFFEKLAAQIIKNLQVKIENVHMRYEDQTTIPGMRFSAGITLNRLAFQTCDSSGKAVILTNDTTKEFFKLAKLDSLAIYWNHDTKLYANLPTGPLRNMMNSSIASFEKTTTGMNYILRPISFDALMHVHMQPEKVQFMIPQIGVNIKFEEIEIDLQHNQYLGLALFLSSLDRIILQNKFRKYKSLAASNNYSRASTVRWMFAYNAVLEEIVRRRARMWSWQYIKEHRQMIRDYTNLWTNKLMNVTLTPLQQAKIDYFEDELDVMNLALARQRAEIRASKNKTLKEKASSGGGGWFSWILGGSSTPGTNSADSALVLEDSSGVMQRVQEEMTQDEKQKLYAALNYTEGMGRSSYPPDYISTIINFSLGGLAFMLTNSELKNPNILKIQVNTVTFDFKQRSGDNAMDLALKLADFVVVGARNSYTAAVPTLISSTAPGESLLSVNFEKNPLDRTADQRLYVSAAPLQVVYDADTINKVVDFFRISGGLRLDEISSSVMPTLDEMKAMTTTGLRYLVSQRTYLDLQIDIQSSHFLLPELGVYTDGCRLIMVDFGSVSLRSIRAQLDLLRTDKPVSDPSNSTQVGRAQSDERYQQLMQANYEQLLSEAYDQFEVSLTATRIILVQQGDNFMQLCSQADSPGHVLRPLSVRFVLRRCIASREFGLPQFQVQGRLPLLSIDLTNQVMESFLDVIAHIPLPEVDPSQRMPTDPVALLKNVQFFDAHGEDLLPGQLKAQQVLRMTEKISSRDDSLSSNQTEDSSEIFFDSHENLDEFDSTSEMETIPKPLANLVTVEVSFLVEKIRIRLFEAASTKNLSDPSAPMLVFAINQIGADFTLRQWDQEINAYVNHLSLKAPRFQEHRSNDPLCLIDTSSKSTNEAASDSENLFTAHFLIANKSGPEFATIYSNTRHSLLCKFRVLKVRLHKEALVALMGFFTDLAKIFAKNPNSEEQLKSKDQTAIEWANRVGDTEGSILLADKSVVSNREARLNATKTTPVDSVSDVLARKNERRDIRVGAVFEAAKIGRHLKILEVDATQWKIQATLDNVQVFFCSTEMQLMAFSMRGMRVDLRTTYLTTEIALALTDICISDLIEESLYRQILWIEPGKDVFLVQSILYNRGTQAPEFQYDPDKVDVAVNLQFGKAHIIMLYLFLRRVLSFMESFHAATKYAMAKASEVTDAAKHQVEQLVKQPPASRVALAVNFEAPVIYMPQNSSSRAALVFDLGRILISNVFEVIPRPRIPKDSSIDILMMENMSVRLEDFKMSAATLIDGGLGAERNVIQPINLSINMRRKVFPSEGDGVPLFSVSGTLESVRLSMTYGDYKLINEVFIDNFEEADLIMGPLSMDVTTDTAMEGEYKSLGPGHSSSSPSETTETSSATGNEDLSLDKATSWNFTLKRLELELFLGTNDPKNWNQEISASRRLGVFTCTDLYIEGDIFIDHSSNIAVQLKDISLTDTRPHSKERITNILSQVRGSECHMTNFIEIYYHSDKFQNQTLDVSVCSIVVCASLDYFMILAKFFTEGAPHRKKPEVVAERASAPKQRQNVASSPPPTNIGTLRIKSNIADPEIILPEDMSNPNCNAILVTTSLNFDYTMLQEETLMNASITNFRILACPFQRTRRSEYSMEVLIPTSVHFYGRQPAGGALHGSINVESLLVTVNASLIRSISKIMNQLAEDTADVSLIPRTTTLRVNRETSDEREDFWTIKPVMATDIFIPLGQTDFESYSEETGGCDVADALNKVIEDRDEKIAVRIDYMCLSMESQLGNKQVPMLLIEAHVDGELKSPSTALALCLNFELSVSFYNDHVSEWEQLLETLPAEGNRLWSLQLVYNSAEPESQRTTKECQNLSSLQNAGRSLALISEDNLEITISKTALDVLGKLGRSFEEAYMPPKTAVPQRESTEIKAPYVLRNQTGLPLMVVVDGQRLRTSDNVLSGTSTVLAEKPKTIGLVGHAINPGEDIGFHDALMTKTVTIQNLRSAPKTPPRPIHLGLAPSEAATCKDCNEFSKLTTAIKIHRTADYIISAASVNLGEDPQPIVASISAFLGQKTVFLQSTLLVINETPEAIRIYSPLPRENGGDNLLGVISGGGSFSLPVGVVTNKEVTGVRICPDLDNPLPSSDIIYWPPKACPQTARLEDRGDTCIYLLPRPDASSRDESEWPVQEVTCSVPLKSSGSQGNSVYNYTVTFLPRFSGGHTGKPIFLQPPNSNAMEPVAYNMVIRAPASLHNHLPVPVTFDLCNFGELQPGHVAVLSSVKSSGFSFAINFTYNNKDYMGRITVNSKTDDMSILTCETHDGYDISFLNLGLRCSRRLGHIDLTIYCPYWLVNKTGLALTYKDQNQLEIIHPANFSGVLLFSVSSKTAKLQQKIVMKADDSLWSPKFSLDTVGNWDRIHCEGTLGRSYEIGVKIDLSNSGLTKIITFMPYFMIVNKTPLMLECAQVRDLSRNILDSWIPVDAGDVKPFWPATGDTHKMLMTCRVDQRAVTDCFPLYESNTVLLKLPAPYIGLYTDVQTTAEATVINLQLYKEGMALVHIINDLGGGRTVSFYQKGTSVTHTLNAGQRMFYTWDDATKPRQFFLIVENQQKTKQIEITTDCYESFADGSTTIHIVSFLSKLQRTLLLTTDSVVANLSVKSGELESTTDHVSVVLKSIGISLVANQLCKEICYISIRSSDVIWNKLKRGNRLKPLKPETSEALENLYNTFLLNVLQGKEFPKRVTLPDPIRPVTTVDMTQMIMLEPENCSLQRTFEPGIQVQYRASASQMQIHAKIFHVQIDSQRLDTTFPVAFAPYPQPNSVNLDSNPKALVEILAVIYKTTDKEVYRFKRLECLIQEMQFQFDQGFINDMIDYFSSSVTIQDELDGFIADQNLTAGALIDAPVVKDVLQPGRESIIDFIHISPIKMHVSFSLAGSSEGSQNSGFHSDVLELFLQSLGVVLTDLHDVVFKLGYFERRGRIMSLSKVLAEMSRYYSSQAIKQAYVLVLGLDVIGNPFAVIRGVAQGFEDLFYEPVKGAVVGTEEFAEGVKLGVKSLFGHTVGGAAGAVSRIAGTLGKGVAALTMDDDYKRRRRQEMTRTPENFGTGMARSGKGLVMGVVGGVTGVFTQPISGAKKDGVEGFFKGLGKGLIGTVARPVSGVVDFASSSFEGIRRATSTSKAVLPVRPPRFIHPDGVIRPYDRNEAEGNIIFSRLRDRIPTEEYVFHIPLRKTKGICILTNERVMLVTINDIFGSSAIDWQVRLCQLSDVPRKNESGLELTLESASKTSLFSSPTNLKQIECTPDNASRMLSKMRFTMGEASNGI